MMISIILLVGMVAFLSITQSSAYNCDNAFQPFPDTPNSVACQNGLVVRKCDLDQCMTIGPYGLKPLSSWVFSDCLRVPTGRVKYRVQVKHFTVNGALKRYEIWGHKFWLKTSILSPYLTQYYCPMSHENLRRATCPENKCDPV
ncbi:uncharacterized protein PGTG_15337 [Puccinia graminis f. sp. tritici CRL 75-36-700-3]|uniref:Uncharacterized protein n=1 Tax=Puccinia graminis f. sp. tritici (strain CRL 75-36-700-3 / race SCCL) TaxID=418459 RepID=E3KYU9_PUCGT|nr:uncharacterized protein PGTG_15337 [Puccinia graminis f. sp. tritici CRL 75-36-700-3]EFP89495.2 hypothetical protein PGTG_15337 [Puccinia graminis f. sp. tritici CRL 75-36-700-3]